MTLIGSVVTPVNLRKCKELSRFTASITYSRVVHDIQNNKARRPLWPYQWPQGWGLTCHDLPKDCLTPCEKEKIYGAIETRINVEKVFQLTT
jgi:hypothetical protein